MKKRYLLNISVLGLLILLGAIMGIATMTLNSQSYWTLTNNIVPHPSVANWTRGGVSSNFTFVVNMTGFDNITQINITVPSVFIIPNYRNQSGLKHFGIYNGSTNFTEYQSDKVGVGGWNITFNGTDNGIVMFNQSRSNASNLSDDQYKIYFNLTSTSPGTENTVNFSIVLISKDIGKRISSTYDFVVTGGVDDLAPRLVNLNISDGTHVLRDSLAKGDPASLNGTGWLNNNSKITVTIEILEYNRRGTETYLFWNTSVNVMPGVPTSLDDGWHRESSGNSLGNGSSGGIINMTRRSTCKNTDTGLQRCIYNATLAAGNFSDGNTTSIVIFMNDTFNHVSIWNNSESGYNFTIDGTNDNIKPRLININISDGTYVLKDDLAGNDPRSLNGTGWVKNNSNIVVTIEVNESTRRGSVVYLFWNSSRMAKIPTALTGGWLNRTSVIPNSNATTGGGGVINMTRRSACKNTNLGVRSCIYTATLAASNFTDKNTTSIVIFMNDTFNTVSIWNNSGKGYNFSIDGMEPTTTITMPSDTLIDAQRPITIKCTGSDDDSGANIPQITITDPAGGTTTRTVDVSTNEATFSASETGRAGQYSVECTVSDQVGKSGSTSITDAFKVLSGGVSGGGGAGGGAGGEGREVVKEFDIDFTKVDSKTIRETKGASVTLTFDGVTEHKINFDDVTFVSITITISSNPITLTINKGEGKKVDINADGIPDMSIKLSEIDGDQAAILVTKLEGAVVVVEEETKAREEAEEKARAEEIKEKEATSKKTLWITLAIVVVVIIAIVIILKSRGKGKRGSVKFTRKDLGY